MSEFDETEIAGAAHSLSDAGRVAFGALCCERLLPNYEAFSLETGWGEPAVLRDALDAAWRWLCGESSGTLEVRSYLKRIEPLTPNTEDFDSVSVSSALDAATAVGALLELIIDSDVEHLIEIASFARDTVDMFVQELENIDAADPNLEERIAKHPLMRREMSAQRVDLDLARSIVSVGQGELSAIRSARVPGASNIRTS